MKEILNQKNAQTIQCEINHQKLENKVNQFRQENETLRNVIFDLLDGQSNWDEIHKQTGLSKERCKEISGIFNKIVQGYAL